MWTRDQSKRTNSKNWNRNSSQYIGKIIPGTIGYDSNSESYEEPEVTILFSDIHSSVKECIQTRVFNIAKLGLLVGCTHIGPAGLIDAVVYLNYLDDIYENTSRLRSGKRQSTTKADRYLGRAKPSEINTNMLVRTWGFIVLDKCMHRDLSLLPPVSPGNITSLSALGSPASNVASKLRHRPAA